MTTTKSQILDFTMGADPEFSWNNVHDDSIVSAGNYFSGDNFEMGYDGNGVTVEVRPNPSKNPLRIVNNIRTIFMEKSYLKPEILEFNWFAGSEKSGKPLGGHIHFGLKPTEIDYALTCKILSNYLGATMLLVEDREQALRRRGQYGGMLDMRTQSWGLEYRTPSSWLTSPYIASSVLCLGKTVVWEILNNPTFKESFINILTESDFRNMNTDKVRTNFPTIWEGITKMLLYQKYKPYIDILHFHVTNNLTWFPKCDMKEAWGIVKVDSNTNSNLTLDTLWFRYKSISTSSTDI